MSTTRRVGGNSPKQISCRQKLECIIQARTEHDLEDFEWLSAQLREGILLADAARELDDDVANDKETLDAITEGLALFESLDSVERIDEAYSKYQDEKCKRKEESDRRKQLAEINGIAADFGEWDPREGWTPVEAAALAIGLDPIKFEVAQRTSRVSVALSRRYRDALDRVDRAQDLKLGGVGGKYIKPIKFRSWAKNNIPDNAFSRIEGNADAPQANERKISTPELNSLYRILLGLALKNYGFKLEFDKEEDSPSRDGAFAKIEADVKATGLTVDIKTVRKHLKEARRRYLPIADRIKRSYRK